MGVCRRRGAVFTPLYYSLITGTVSDADFGRKRVENSIISGNQALW